MIGHVGVMLPTSDAVYFVEKVAFQEPYRLLKFINRTELSDYLMLKYDNSWGQDTAHTFIMENSDLMDGWHIFDTADLNLKSLQCQRAGGYLRLCSFPFALCPGISTTAFNWFSRRSLQFFHIGSLSFCISVKHFDFVHILLYLVHDESERESATASCETWAVLTNNFKEAAKIIAALLNSKQKR